ncbi:hypothetical protein, partial [Crocosphaera watsonii]
LILKDNTSINLTTLDFLVSGELLPIASDTFQVKIDNYELDVVNFDIPSLGLFNVDKFVLDKSVKPSLGDFFITETSGELFVSFEFNWLNTESKIIHKGIQTFEVTLSENTPGFTDILIEGTNSNFPRTSEPTNIIGLLVFCGFRLLVKFKK